VRVWDPTSGRALLTLEGHTDWVTGVVVTPDRERAVSASDDKTLKVWDLASGQCVATFQCDGPPRCCAFVNNSRMVAGDAGGRVHFLSLEAP